MQGCGREGMVGATCAGARRLVRAAHCVMIVVTNTIVRVYRPTYFDFSRPRLGAAGGGIGAAAGAVCAGVLGAGAASWEAGAVWAASTTTQGVCSPCTAIHLVPAECGSHSCPRIGNTASMGMPDRTQLVGVLGRAGASGAAGRCLAGPEREPFARRRDVAAALGIAADRRGDGEPHPQREEEGATREIVSHVRELSVRLRAVAAEDGRDRRRALAGDVRGGQPRERLSAAPDPTDPRVFAARRVRIRSLAVPGFAAPFQRITGFAELALLRLLLATVEIRCDFVAHTAIPTTSGDRQWGSRNWSSDTGPFRFKYGLCNGS